MTMHLVGPYMTTTQYNRKKKQKKMTASKQEQLRIQWRQHNKDCRRRHIHSAQFEKFEDFIDYVNGTYTPPKDTTPRKSYVPPEVRKTPDYPSLSNGVSGHAPAKEPQKYTGTYITGIATMHKSNMVPITSKKDAIEVARMRRG